eukprot:8719626-Alexandrium_andersonii.AAC.1
MCIRDRAGTARDWSIRFQGCLEQRHRLCRGRCPEHTDHAGLAGHDHRSGRVLGADGTGDAGAAPLPA